MYVECFIPLSATHHAAEAANYFAVKLLCNANAPVLGENSEVSGGRGLVVVGSHMLEGWGSV